MCFCYSFALKAFLWKYISTNNVEAEGKNGVHIMKFYRNTLLRKCTIWNVGTHYSCLFCVRGMEKMKVLHTLEYLFVLKVSSLRIWWRRKLLTSGARYLNQFRKYTPRNSMITLLGTCSNTAPCVWVCETSKTDVVTLTLLWENKDKGCSESSRYLSNSLPTNALFCFIYCQPHTTKQSWIRVNRT